MNRFLPFLLLFCSSTQAQELLHCGADEIRIQTLQANPKIAEAVIERDAELEAFTREYAEASLREPQGTQRGGQIYTIPVVFHVIHKFGNENISREQILDGLDVLNATFRKQIPDTADIHEDFKPIHADCEIEFALATKDPDGNCHSGINRIASTLTNSGDHRVKGLIHWDPSMYLNVYIVSNAAGLAGHAVWPSDADTIPEWDGIVMSHSYVGRIGTSDQTRSVVFAHELGHYLNLHHIWGGNNVPDFYYLPVGQQTNCGEDDLVGDTPNTIGWSNCNLNASSCGSPRDNVQNAMDYSYCNVMFTEGQKTRMRACLNSSIANRNNLWTPANLSATGVTPEPSLCAADFEADKTLICHPSGEAVNFTNTSFHGEIDSVYWEFPGGDSPFSVIENPVLVYYQPGSFDVSLTAYSNGNAATVTKEDYIIFLDDSSWAYPFWEWFEGSSNLSGNPWVTQSADLQNQWEITDLSGHSIPHAALVDNWENQTLTVDDLYGPPINLDGASSMRLGFWYAFSAQETPTNNTKFQVQVSRNCETNWSTRLTINGADLLTAPVQAAPFVPSQSEWIQESINIPSSYFEDGFRFRFKFTSEGNNRFFIDDINVDVTAGITVTDPSISSIEVYPNPVTDVLSITVETLESSSAEIGVMDVLGKDVLPIETIDFNPGTNTRFISTTNLQPGVYLVYLRSKHQAHTKRFIVN